MPKEHGAYGQLAAPLLAALLSRWPTAAALLFTVAAVCAFLAHEPLLVLLGQRGSRRRREQSARAGARLALLAVASLGCGGLALTLAAPAARLAVAAPLGGVMVLALLIWCRQERSCLGEIFAAGVLSAAAIPVAVASGGAPGIAWAGWGVFSLGFGTLTLAVRRAIPAHRNKPAARRAAGEAWMIAGLFLLFFYPVAGAPASVAVAISPMGLLGGALLVAPPHPSGLRRVGWLLMLASLTTALLLAHASWRS